MSTECAHGFRRTRLVSPAGGRRGSFLAATLSAVAWISSASGQTTNYVVDQFDTNTAGLYANQAWGTAVPVITWDASQNALTTLAANNPGSGAGQWQIAWPTTDDQIEVTRFFNNGTVLNLNNFSSVSFDILFASNSATDGRGSYGTVEVDAIPQSAGWPSTALAAYTSAVSNGNGWLHVTLPVSAAGNSALAAVTGMGLKIQQSSTGANLAGTTAFWIDNIIFSGFAAAPVTGPPQIVQLNPAQVWQRLEFQITNVPAGPNPFDPSVMALDATFTLPSGKDIVMPGFWYQAYQRSQIQGGESDTVAGPAQWRVRFMPPEAGAYTMSVAVRTNGLALETLVTNFTAASNAPLARFGYVQLAPGNEYFQTGDGQGLPLKGEDVAWPDAGTYSYDTWFGAMQNAGENFARVWMSPWSFGIEDAPGTLTRYALAPAWQLDYVLQLAEQEGIYLQLTLDYDGMFATQTNYWGGGNYWLQNPYSTTNGGPCVNPDAFFTNSAAAGAYQKRLRYLIGRYGYSQNVLAWEFFNEIDNDYAYLNANDVAAWHGRMGDWMQVNDPNRHLLTTSLTYASSHPEIWSLPQLSYSSEHAYTMTASPLTIASDSQYFLKTYGKPIMIGEFGTDWRGWDYDNSDPFMRGFREGIWSGALGGSVGTAMAWWWDSLPSYTDYSALTAILGQTGWGQGQWSAVGFQNQAGVSAIGLAGTREALVYVVASDANFPAGGTNATLPVLTGAAVTLTNLPNGSYWAEWHDPATGAVTGTNLVTATKNTLPLALPPFSVDQVGVICLQPALTMFGINTNGAFEFQLNAATGRNYVIERSGDLSHWAALMTVSNSPATSLITDIGAATNGVAFYRARQLN